MADAKQARFPNYVTIGSVDTVAPFAGRGFDLVNSDLLPVCGTASHGRVDVLLHCAPAAAGAATVARVENAVSVLCPGVEVRVQPEDRPLPVPTGKLRPIRSLVGMAT